MLAAQPQVQVGPLPSRRARPNGQSTAALVECSAALDLLLTSVGSLNAAASASLLVRVVELQAVLVQQQLPFFANALLMKLPFELLQLVTEQIREDDALAFALVSKRTSRSVLGRFSQRAFPASLRDKYARERPGQRPGKNLKRLRCGPSSCLTSLSRLKWAVGAGMPLEGFPGHQLFSHAAKLGNMDFVRFLHNAGCEMNKWACEAAARGCHLELLAWLRVIECEGTRDASISYMGAGAGHLAVCQWARDNGCPWDTYAREARAAARGGHLHVLEWLGTHGCAWDSQVTWQAAKAGQLAAMQMAHSFGCPVDGMAAAAAARAGDVDALQWMLATVVVSGMEHFVVNGASSGGHVHVLEWALAHGFDVAHERYTESAASCCSLDTIEWLVAHDCPLSEDCVQYAIEAAHVSSGHETSTTSILEMLQWLVDHGGELQEAACASAAYSANLQVLQWLRAHGCPWSPGEMQSYLTTPCTRHTPELRRWLAEELGNLPVE